MTTTKPTIAPEDVRPGVWLMHPTGKLIQVTGILKNRFHDTWEVYYDLNESEGAQCIVPLDDCAPIEISKDILIAIGFDSVSKNEHAHEWNYWSQDLDASVDLDIDGIFRYRVHEKLRRKSVFYLHRLQNLHLELKIFEIPINPAQLAEAVKGKNA